MVKLTVNITFISCWKGPCYKTLVCYISGFFHEIESDTDNFKLLINSSWLIDCTSHFVNYLCWKISPVPRWECASDQDTSARHEAGTWRAVPVEGTCTPHAVLWNRRHTDTLLRQPEGPRCRPPNRWRLILVIGSVPSIYVSPIKWGDILFLAPLSVCPSVCLSVRPSVRPSHFRVRSISFEPLVGFTNNFAQMSSMMRRCAVPRFDQGRFKVKVTI